MSLHDCSVSLDGSLSETWYANTSHFYEMRILA